VRTDHQIQTAVGNRYYAGGLVEYDAVRKRVWIGGQRLHHGLTGALVAAAGLAGLAAHRMSPRGSLEIALFGSVLMAHDWHDRTHWFERGYQAED
jgi:hypothetical protein